MRKKAGCALQQEKRKQLCADSYYGRVFIMKKKKDISGLIFSAFLIIAFVVCSYFFIGIIRDSTAFDNTVRLLLKSLVMAVFGLILFYATRVGDGKQIRRFSLSALILVDLPALYIILAACFVQLPFPFDLSAAPETVSIAAVALGYGIPYTFLSGYELDVPKKDEEKSDEDIITDDDEKTASEENTLPESDSDDTASEDSTQSDGDDE